MLAKVINRRGILLLALLLGLVLSFQLPSTSTAQGAPAWMPGTAYTAGQVVSYAGASYRCVQPHTAQVGWEPPTTPALWERMSGTVPTATPRPQPSPPGPPATSTRTPPPATPSATAPTGSCTVPVWNRTTVYTSGSIVSHNGRKWRAGWWTQGEEPGTTGQWGVWQDQGPCSSGNPTATTPAPTATPTRTPPAATATTTPPGPTRTPGPTVTPGPGGERRIIGYFTAWGVYGRNYHVKNVDTSGSAAKLTHINYAFANISNDLRCQIGDSYAEYDRFYSAAQSVSGAADSWDTGALRGNFNQLRQLKAKYPHLKVMISVGGWTWSDKFSDAALPQNRVAFVRSCIELYIKGNFAPGLSHPGVFDGIDIDWEYPAACGLTCNIRPEDTQNFTALLAEFRSQLNALSQTTGKPYLLTIAAPAGPDKIDKIEVDRIHPYLDFINLMTYDFHGPWESTTNFQSALYPAAGDPTRPLRYTVDEAVSLWLTRGTPASKLVVGVPFYSRGWAGVPNTNNGLWQSSTGGAPGTYEAGIEDYKVIKTKGYPRFYSTEAQAAWIYSASEGIFWTLDDPAVMAAKMAYIRNRSLGGTMFWELSGDTDNGELINALYSGLR